MTLPPPKFLAPQVPKFFTPVSNVGALMYDPTTGGYFMMALFLDPDGFMYVSNDGAPGDHYYGVLSGKGQKHNATTNTDGLEWVHTHPLTPITYCSGRVRMLDYETTKRT